jgi:REP element-mobilizing transposase RayT
MVTRRLTLRTMLRPRRRRLPHEVLTWVEDGACYFLTICANDRSSGALLLCAEVLLSAAEHYHEQGRWFLHLFVLMPDHVHLLAGFPQETGLRQTVHAWKRFSARRGGFAWQRDFFEHRLRHDESFDEKAHYVRMNPVRAGLCGSWEAWPHRWPR